MTSLILFCTLQLCCLVAVSQEPARTAGEFTVHSNGFIYSDSSMRFLRQMVEKENIRFRACTNNKAFYSLPQTAVYRYSFESKKNSLAALRNALDSQTDPAIVLQQFGQYLDEGDTASLIVSTADDVVEAYSGSPAEGYNQDYVISDSAVNILPGTWIYRYYPKEGYRDAYSVDARYIVEPLVQQRLPEEYSRLIEYVDCMVDTSASMILKTSYSELFEESETFPEKTAVMRYLERNMSVAESKKETGEELYAEQVTYAKLHLKGDPEFLRLLSVAADSCMSRGINDEFLEVLVEEVLSKRKALDMKRHYVVVGNCSQDQRPRMHARDMAILAAESFSWDLFMRAHLDILNDRFARVTDGSYAWQGRRTYLRELEALDLDVIGLMIGMSLRADNTSRYHYYGSIGRVGRALSESRERAAFESRVHLMLKDTALDEFNRGMIFLLYENYLWHLENVNEANEKIRALKKTQEEYPVSLHKAIAKMEKRED